MVKHVAIKFSDNHVANGRVVWSTEEGAFIEFDAIGIQDRWFTKDELKEKVIISAFTMVQDVESAKLDYIQSMLRGC